MQGDQIHTHGRLSHRHSSAPDYHAHLGVGASYLDWEKAAKPQFETEGADECATMSAESTQRPIRQMSAIEAAQEVYRAAVRAEKTALADAELAATLGRKLWQLAAEKSEQVGAARFHLLEIADGDLTPQS